MEEVKNKRKSNVSGWVIFIILAWAFIAFSCSMDGGTNNEGNFMACVEEIYGVDPNTVGGMAILVEDIEDHGDGVVSLKNCVAGY